MSTLYTRVRGTEDHLNLLNYTALVNHARAHVARYNFHEIETPILEHTDLFMRSLGLHTDVVTKEMYTLQTASGEQLCLRPEMTAPTMRAFLSDQAHLIRPWRVFSCGPVFRHERPQKGRWRQFTQFNLEMIGAASISYDAQFIAMLDAFMGRELGLIDYVIHLNFLGTPHDRAHYMQVLGTFLDTHMHELCETCHTRRSSNILRVLDCKNETCKRIYQNAPIITDTLCESSQREWHELQAQLMALSVTFVVRPHLVRGLDYYNKTVFEFTSPHLGSQDAFCGGGRYDGLAEELGSREHVPALGASIGIGRLLLILEQAQNTMVTLQKPALNVIIPLSGPEHTLALLLADNLIRHKRSVEVIFDATSIKNALRKANALGAATALIIGEDERAAGTVSIKNLQTGESVVVSQVEAHKHTR